MPRTPTLFCALLVVGCKPGEPAPADLDSLAAYLWTIYDEGSDEAWAEAVASAYVAGGAATLDGHEDGTISDLTAEDLGALVVEGADPADAVGLYLVRVMDCTLEQLEPVLLAQDQASLYTGIYDSYQRTYTADLDAYVDRQVAVMSWETEYAASFLGTAYTATTRGAVRYVPETDEHGPAIVQRTYMPQPATFDDPDKSFTQDYQMEVYVRRGEEGSGQLFHFYPLWREVDYGGAAHSDNESYQGILLKALHDWDDTTEQLCADGVP